MAKLLNDAGAHPRLDENEPNPSAEVDRVYVIKLYAERSGDRVGQVLAGVLSETRGDHWRA